MLREITFLLVEDEPLILQQLACSIQACDKNFRIVGTAENGQEGLEKIELLKPDIIITDIQMPILSGLDMISAAREKNLGGKYLILSGYSEFQYARSALLLNVNDYLLKPIDPDGLVQKLLALSQEIYDEQTQRISQYLRSWFLPEITSAAQPDMPSGMVCYFIFAEAGAATSRIDGELSPGMQFWKENQFAWLDEIESNWTMQIEHFPGKYINEHIFAIVHDQSISQGHIRTLAQEMLRSCHCPIPLCLIVTEPMRTAKDFSCQMRNVATCRMMAFPFGASGVWCMGTDILSPISEMLPQAFCSLAVQSVSQIHTNLDTALGMLTDYWSKTKPCEAILLRQLGYLLGKLKDGGYDTDALTAVELIANVVSFADIVDSLRPFLQPDPSKQDKYSGASAQINEIKHYIDQNFSKPISYHTLYEKFGYSEKYIAYLFKKEIGVSPSKYIVSVRIQAAKQLLLRQPGILQKDVAQMVGFTDPLYFSRVFRDFVGMSPSRFVKEQAAE